MTAFPLAVALGVLLMAGFQLIPGQFLGEARLRFDTFSAQEERRGDRYRTELEVLSASASSPYVLLTVRNAGQTSFGAFDTWDVSMRYMSSATTLNTNRLTYTTSVTPSANQWTVATIYSDWSGGTAEAHGKGMLDPGEEMVVRANPSPAPLTTGDSTVSISAPNGVGVRVGFAWETLTVPTDLVGEGVSLAGDGTYVYALLGRSTKNVRRYDPATNAWTARADTSATVKSGAGMAFVERDGVEYLYAALGSGKTFERYSPVSDSWAARSDLPNASNQTGVAWDGGDRLYSLKGSGTATFWYHGVGANTWGTLADAPASLSAGGALAYLSPYAYALRGNGTTSLWRYSQGANTWATLASTPAAVASGGSLVTDGEALYATAGDGSATLWRYSVVLNEWNAYPSLPAVINDYASSAVQDGYLYLISGNGTNTFARIRLPQQLR